jgi:hypothetical protein
MLTPGAIGEDLTDFFCAAQVSTAITGAVFVELAEPAELAQQRLEQERFDQAPVRHKGRTVGWIATAALTAGRSIKSLMTPMEDCALVSAEASIAAILQLLLDEQFIFTVSKQGLSGFIVHSDIDRHAVRSYLYLLISGTEMLLAEIVKSAITEDRIAASIRARMRKAYYEARAENQETSPAEYLYIGELVKLFNQTDYARDPHLWDSSSQQLLMKVKGFRNSVMHPVRSIAAADNIETAAHLPEWTEAIAERLRAIIASLNG